MPKISIALILGFLVWAYLVVYQFPYYIWTFALSQNWFTQNGLILFKDIIYHHTQLPLFSLFGMSKIFGNTPEMLQASSFVLLIFFGWGIFLLGKKISKKVGMLSFAIFVLTFLPLFHNFNIEEMMASLFGVYATYFYLKFWDRMSPIWFFLSGVLVALAIMSKQSIGLIIIGYLLISGWHIHENNKLIKSAMTGLIYFLIGGILGTLPFFIYYFVNDSISDFVYWNIIFNLTIYPKQSVPYAFSEGMAASYWMFIAVIVSVFLLFKRKIEKTLRFPLVLLIACTIFLSTSLLPSFLVYKILPFYPYPIIIWAVLLTHIKLNFIKFSAVIGLLLIFPVLKSFYVEYLPTAFFNGEFIIDYGEDELKVVDWLKKNTKEKSLVMNLGHHYVTTLAGRLPANKYVYLFPWLVYPYDKSTEEILKNPPLVVIVDWRTFDDFPDLKKWPFIEYVKNNYKIAGQYGTYEIFVDKK